MRVLLADDHALVRDGMRPFLERLDDDVKILEASSLNEAIEIAATVEDIDLALLDLRMPGMDGLNGLTKFRERYPSAKVVIVSGQFGRTDINSALEKGAAGYVPKTIGGNAMLNALRLVMSGERYLPSVMIEESSYERRGGQGGNDGLPSDSPLANLTKREWEVLGQLIEGNSNKQIARLLGLEEITVKIHLRNVYRKMGISNRAQAVRVALQNDWEQINEASA